MSSTSTPTEAALVPVVAAGAWRPILTGELADEAQRAIAAIDADLANRAESLVHGPALSSGSSGLALFYAYLSQTDGEPHAEEHAMRWMDHAISGLGSEPLSPGLFAGMTGVAWTLAHLLTPEERLDDEQFTSIDEVLDELLVEAEPDLHYELVAGLAGMGMYAAERCPSPAATACLSRVIDHLDRTAVSQPTGLTWWTAADRLPPWERDEFPAGYANLGVAHGVPGVIGLLSQAIARGVAVEQSQRLLRGAVPWLLAQQLPAGGDARFGYSTGQSDPARLAWCYGDLGIAAVLLTAADATGDANWRREAIEIARLAARTTEAASGVQDAGLCHGAAGAGHLFNRLYQTTGDLELLVAAERWFAIALRSRRSERGIGGFPAMIADGTPTGHWADVPGFLEGAAGVGLALLAATTAVEPQWDRALLASLPPIAK